jgi:hypothetical protein
MHTRNKYQSDRSTAVAQPTPFTIPEPPQLPILGFSPADLSKPCLRCGSTEHRTTQHDSPPPNRTPLYRLAANGDLAVIDKTRAGDYAQKLIDLATETLVHVAEPTIGGQPVSQKALDLANECLYELTESLDKLWLVWDECEAVSAAAKSEAALRSASIARAKAAL